MPEARKKPCAICRRWFRPDPRIGARQRACSTPECQTTRRRKTQSSWRARNPEYAAGYSIQQRALRTDPPAEPLRLVVDRGRLRVAGGPALVAQSRDRFKRWGAAFEFMSGDEFEVRFLSLDEFELKDVHARMLGPDLGIVAYTVHEKLTVDGKPVVLEAADSSTWVRRNGQWECAMHTEAILGDPFGRDKGGKA